MQEIVEQRSVFAILDSEDPELNIKRRQAKISKVFGFDTYEMLFPRMKL